MTMWIVVLFMSFIFLEMTVFIVTLINDNDDHVDFQEELHHQNMCVKVFFHVKDD